MIRSRILAPSRLQVLESLVLEGDVAEVLPRLPDACVQSIITSPPYWGLRDYGIHGQIGLEPTLAAYLHKLAGIFAEARRLLKPDGILWLNVGDGYTSGNRRWRAPDKKNPNRAMSVRPDNPPDLKDKDLLGVPWRLAFALEADGWFLRSDIIWHKPNAMPESVKDRPTRAHQYVFMLTKSEKYAFYADAVLEAAEGRWHSKSTHRLEHQHLSGQRRPHRLLPGSAGRALPARFHRAWRLRVGPLLRRRHRRAGLPAPWPPIRRDRAESGLR